MISYRFQAIRLAIACFILVTVPMGVADELKAPASNPREAWTTSRVHGSPDPPSPYRTKVAFPHLKFDEPDAMTFVPRTNRLVVVQRFGRIYTFENSRDATQLHLLLDLPKVLGVERAEAFGIAFHPRFEENRQFFIHYNQGGVALPTRVARFEVRKDSRWQADPESHTLLISWPNGHNGGCLKFGPDGYLYISNGDQGGFHDPDEVGQGLNDLQSSILRIDVDGADGERPYRIPPDNPFLNIPNAQHEVWAYGFRNPWKFSFDRATGDLWTADVGEDLWESVHKVLRGGNYGWSVEEGGRPFRPQHKRGPTPIIPPIVAHDHSEARSITGGYVYRGQRLEELVGHYIYGDYDTGKVWMLGYDQRVTAHRELCDTTLRVVGFAEDRAGELYLVDHIGGQIHELVVNEMADTSADFPRKLSETGLFASTKDLAPAAGLIAYDVIAPQWSDGSTKQRYMALPGEAKIEFEAVRFPFRGGRDGWKFPDGAVLVETHFLAMEQGNRASLRRLETRILHHERLSGPEDVGDQLWRGYSYIWNDEQTDAELLEDPRGRDRKFVIRDAAAPGGKRQHTWHFPGRTECSICHNMAAKYVLGCQTLQTNRAGDYDGQQLNQLDYLQQLGVFAEPLPKSAAELPRLTDYHDQAQPLRDRARSYLHANCSHCHRNGGGGNADFFALASLDVEATKLLGTTPNHGAFHIPHAAIVKPGKPFQSTIYYRMSSLGGGRMPRLGSRVVDEQGLNLIHDWIAELRDVGQPNASTPEQQPHTVAADLAPIVDATRPAGKRKEIIDQLLSSTIGSLQLARAIDQRRLPTGIHDEVLANAAQGEPHIRDLFERFLPEQQRTQRLGNTIDPKAILALDGDVKQGGHLFFEQSGMQCRSCHRIDNRGDQVGPDLDQIGKKYDRSQILTSILDPSRNIDAKYLQYHCVTAGGHTFSGVLVEKTAQFIVLKNAKSEAVKIAVGDIEVLAAQSKSLMPDLLARDLTAQDLADLVAFLESLK